MESQFLPPWWLFLDVFDFAMEDGFGDWKRWRLHPARRIFWTPSTRLKCHPRWLNAPNFQIGRSTWQI